MWRKDVIEQIDRVEREHRAASAAITSLSADAKRDSILLRAGVEHADLRRCRRNLEATYLARMFAVFEAHLRDVWEVSFKRNTHPKMEDLVNGCAARQGVPYDIAVEVHKVRGYRNHIIHGAPAAYIALNAARSRLTAFFGRMPVQW